MLAAAAAAAACTVVASSSVFDMRGAKKPQHNRFLSTIQCLVPDLAHRAQQQQQQQHQQTYSAKKKGKKKNRTARALSTVTRWPRLQVSLPPSVSYYFSHGSLGPCSFGESRRKKRIRKNTRNNARRAAPAVRAILRPQHDWPRWPTHTTPRAPQHRLVAKAPSLREPA